MTAYANGHFLRRLAGGIAQPRREGPVSGRGGSGNRLVGGTMAGSRLVRQESGALSGAATVTGLRFHGYLDLQDGGTGTVSGTVKVGSMPVSRKVSLLDLTSLRLVRQTWSAADGTYSFAMVAKDRDYLLLADDYTGTYNDVAAARVRAV